MNKIKNNNKRCLIVNIEIDDHELVNLALSLGYEVYGCTSIDPKEHRNKILEYYRNIINIIEIPSRYELRLSPVIDRLRLKFEIYKICRQLKIKSILKTSRYYPSRLSSLMLSLVFPILTDKISQSGLHWDKSLYFYKLINGGVKVPKIYQKIRDQELFKPSSKVEFPVICKPSNCSGGFGIFKALNLEELINFFDVENHPERFSEMNLFYRNKFKKGLRQYVYCSGSVGGSYIVQEYIDGEIYSVSGTVCNNKVANIFSYQIHPTNNCFLAEQAFSGPLSKKLNKKLFGISDKVINVLKYPDGPFMIDFVMDKKKNIYVIDASPRMSLTGAKLSELINKNNDHLKSLFLSHFSIFNQKKSNKVNIKKNVYWGRIPVPKGTVKNINYDLIKESKWLIYENFLLSSGCYVNEMRLDRQMIERGSFATYGTSHLVAKENWNKLFRKIYIDMV